MVRDVRRTTGRKGQEALSGLGDEIKGKAQEAVGAARAGLGKVINTPDTPPAFPLLVRCDEGVTCTGLQPCGRLDTGP